MFKAIPDARFCLFELDEVGKTDKWFPILQAYADMYLDVLVHRTGRGWHWLSPTIVTKDQWKQFHARIKHINRECPMLTMRMEPNKYPNESTIWYISSAFMYGDDAKRNSKNFATYLNKLFGCNFKGDVEGDIELVHYPLPL